MGQDGIKALNTPSCENCVLVIPSRQLQSPTSKALVGFDGFETPIEITHVQGLIRISMVFETPIDIFCFCSALPGLLNLK